MSWGIVAVAGASLVGGALSSSASSKAAGTQADSSRYAADSQERMFDKSLELQEPYREAGYDALTGLQGLITPEGRADSLASFYAGPEYSGMANQAEQATLRNASAQGGLRSGSSYAALQNIAPQLGQNYLSNQYNQLTGLANMGMGAASQGASSANQLGQSQANLAMQAGNAQAQNQLNQAGIWSDTIGQLGGLAYGYGKGYI